MCLSMMIVIWIMEHQRTTWSSIHKKLSNTGTELKKSLLIKKTCICTCEGWYYRINQKYERGKSSKTKVCCRYILCSFIHSFIVLFSFLMWQLKILIDCFSSNEFDEWEHVLFFKNLIKQKSFKFCCIYY